MAFCTASMIGVLLTAGAAQPSGPAGYFCIANGQRYTVGSVACLPVPCAPQLARCIRVLNNTSWEKIQDGCPDARLPTRKTPG